MALTHCRECGKTVSTEARACPHCGCPNPALTPLTATCRECGGSVGSSALTCPHCGYAQLANSATISQSANRAANTPAPIFSDIRPIGKVVEGFLVAQIAVRGVSIPLSLLGAVILSSRLNASPSDAVRQPTGLEILLSCTNLLNFSIYLFGGIIFLIWMAQAHRNLRALGAQWLSYSPAWAVVGWFIPIANFFIPYFVMREIWAASSLADSDAWQQKDPIRPELGLWWGLWVFLAFFGIVAFPFSTFALLAAAEFPDTTGVLVVWFLGTCADALVIIDALLLREIIRQTSERQALKAKRLLVTAA